MFSLKLRLYKYLYITVLSRAAKDENKAADLFFNSGSFKFQDLFQDIDLELGLHVSE